MVSLEEEQLNRNRVALAMVPLILVLLAAAPVSGWTVDGSHGVTFQLEVLQGLLAGPLSGWNVVLYINSGLDPRILRDLHALPALQDTPHVLVDLFPDGAALSREQSAPLLPDAHFVHIVVFDHDPRPFFEAVPLQLDLRYLILFSLANEMHLNLLEDEEFLKVEKLSLICTLTPSQPAATRRMGLYTVYPFSKQSKLRLYEVWNSSVVSNIRHVFPDRFPSFEGYEFQLATWFVDRPFLYQKEGSPVGVSDGVVIDMLDAIAQNLNYTYVTTAESSDGLWGSFENGSWNGVLGMIDRGEKNFTVNTMSLVLDRWRGFQASVPYYMNGYSFVVLEPEPLAKWRSTYYPFTLSVWIGTILTVVLAIIIMTVQDLMQPEPFLGGLGETWTYMVRSVVNHSLPTLPKAQWQRVFVGFWCFYCFILSMAYTANLIAFLTFPFFPERIQTIHELAESKLRVVMLDYGEFVPQALRMSLDQDYRTISKKLEVARQPESIVGLIKQRTHALLEFTSIIKIILPVDFNVKNTYMVKEQIYPTHQCWYFGKNVSWKHKFDKGIQRLLESGLISYWTKMRTEIILKEVNEERRQLAEKANYKKILTMENVQGVFFIIFMGWILSFSLFIYELQKLGRDATSQMERIGVRSDIDVSN